MKNIFLLITIMAVFTACDHRKDLADAYGNFEVEDVIVSAETTGKLISFQVSESEKVSFGSLLGVIDTTQIVLQINQLDAQVKAVVSKIDGIKAQISTQNQQKANLKVNVERVEKLLQSGVATQQQKDDLDGQMKLIDKQIEASKTQISSVLKEAEVLKQQKYLLDYQLSKCKIISPVNGVIIEKYGKEGEMAIMGKPLFKVADLSSLDLRCYIPGEKLALLQLGTKVKVRIDGENNKTEELEGVVSWISSEAEFTPRIIQTKEERVKLVYAVKVNVKNNGKLKIGMPGEMSIN